MQRVPAQACLSENEKNLPKPPESSSMYSQAMFKELSEFSERLKYKMSLRLCKFVAWNSHPN